MTAAIALAICISVVISPFDRLSSTRMFVVACIGFTTSGYATIVAAYLALGVERAPNTELAAAFCLASRYQEWCLLQQTFGSPQLTTTFGIVGAVFFIILAWRIWDHFYGF